MARCGYCGIDHRRFSLRRAVQLILHRQTEQTLYILEQIGKIMTDQEHLDADVAQLTAAVGVIAQEIADLKNQPGAGGLDFTGLDAAVAAVAGLEPQPPVEESPAE